MKDIEEDVMAELDGIEKLDSEENLSGQVNLSFANESPEGESTPVKSCDEEFADFGSTPRAESFEASPFTQLIMEERRRLASIAPLKEDNFSSE